VIIPDTGHPILFFDGICNLCNHAVQFVIRHDKKKRFLFASLQSGIGAEAIRQVKQINSAVPDSLILFYRGKYYTHSGAALYATKFMSGLLPLLQIALVIPPFIRNGIYRIIARNRYKWFGKRNECMIPAAALKSRFLTTD
jgi:predicted DCC family thiol-disulfide oxidoreductase YuxK